MHVHGIIAGNDVGRVSIAFEQLAELVFRDPRQHGRIRDLVPVQMQDGQHRPIRPRIEEFVRMPAGGQRPCFRLAVADNAEDFE